MVMYPLKHQFNFLIFFASVCVMLLISSKVAFVVLFVSELISNPVHVTGPVKQKIFG